MANCTARCLMARLWNGSRKSTSLVDVCRAEWFGEIDNHASFPHDRTLQLLPRAVELANVVYIFDNTQTAELILQAIDGALNMLKPTVPNWVETGLILPYSQRSVARQAIEMFAYPSRATFLPPSLGDYRGGAIRAYWTNTELRSVRLPKANDLR